MIYRCIMSYMVAWSTNALQRPTAWLALTTSHPMSAPDRWSSFRKRYQHACWFGGANKDKVRHGTLKADINSTCLNGKWLAPSSPQPLKGQETWWMELAETAVPCMRSLITFQVSWFWWERRVKTLHGMGSDSDRSGGSHSRLYALTLNMRRWENEGGPGGQRQSEIIAKWHNKNRSQRPE